MYCVPFAHVQPRVLARGLDGSPRRSKENVQIGTFSGRKGWVASAECKSARYRLLAMAFEYPGIVDFDQALNIRKQLAVEFPNRPDLRNELAGTSANLALLHQRLGN